MLAYAIFQAKAHAVPSRKNVQNAQRSIFSPRFSSTPDDRITSIFGRLSLLTIRTAGPFRLFADERFVQTYGSTDCTQFLTRLMPGVFSATISSALFSRGDAAHPYRVATPFCTSAWSKRSCRFHGKVW